MELWSKEKVSFAKLPGISRRGARKFGKTNATINSNDRPFSPVWPRPCESIGKESCEMSEPAMSVDFRSYI